VPFNQRLLGRRDSGQSAEEVFGSFRPSRKVAQQYIRTRICLCIWKNSSTNAALDRPNAVDVEINRNPKLNGSFDGGFGGKFQCGLTRIHRAPPSFSRSKVFTVSILMQTLPGTPRGTQGGGNFIEAPPPGSAGKKREEGPSTAPHQECHSQVRTVNWGQAGPGPRGLSGPNTPDGKKRMHGVCNSHLERRVHARCGENGRKKGEQSPVISRPLEAVGDCLTQSSPECIPRITNTGYEKRGSKPDAQGASKSWLKLPILIAALRR